MDELDLKRFKFNMFWTRKFEIILIIIIAVNYSLFILMY